MRLGLTALIVAIAGSALAQQAAAPMPRETTCVETAQGDKKSPQAIESQAIVPAVGGEKNSAADTVQRQGRSVEASSDCPPDTAAAAAKRPAGTDPTKAPVNAQSK
jgi:hypothetical protein